MYDQLFRKLNPSEKIQFRQWARVNYIVGSEISTIWHPVIRTECMLMNLENKNERT